MFKYGNAKKFIIKLFFGSIIVLVSLFFFISLASHNINDPGFRKIIEVSEIINIFGYQGAMASSILLAFFGHCSYVFVLFLLSAGIKFLLGINYTKFFFKFLLVVLGTLFINIFLGLLNISFYKIGIIYELTNNISYDFYYQIFQSIFLLYFIAFLFFLIGFISMLYCFGIKITYLNNFFIIFYPLKFFLKINPFTIIAYIFNLLKSNEKKGGMGIKNEPILDNYKRSANKSNLNTSHNQKNNSYEDYKFQLPNYSILIKSSQKDSYTREIEKNNRTSAAKLEKTLLEYGIEGKIINFKTGPIVTLFEFVPKPGTKASKIISLADDISRAMSSISARISSQPGKTSLGIEIPNPRRESVLFGDLINNEKFKLKDQTLKLALGKNISGEKVFADLERMPHLLIAGTTGSGKSVGINTMILSLLFRFAPNECKLILIDPKMLELSVYEDIPHLLTPVVTDPNKAVFALKWVVREMENRYKLMSSINVKNIKSYNEKVLKTLSSGRKLFREVQTGIDNETRTPIIEKREIPLENMPFIVVVIDEMADLMMVAGKEVENLVQRLAQMARASGIHLITATQRPSVDVITGTIKANFPSRISYKVASKFDSRTILNEMGAEQLLGSGDMLFLENGANLKRLHGGFVSEAEVENVVRSIKDQATFDQNKEISLNEEDVNNSRNFNMDTNGVDELYNKAVEIIVSQQKVSTSFVQRYLQIGYNRAARIVEKMEENGIISEANNAGKRQVLKKK